MSRSALGGGNAYTHVCNEAASYQPKPKPKSTHENWQKVTDVSGRGFHKEEVNPWKKQEPKRYQEISKVPPNLDTNNRYFKDNQQIYNKYANETGKQYGPAAGQPSPERKGIEPTMPRKKHESSPTKASPSKRANAYTPKLYCNRQKLLDIMNKSRTGF